MNSQIKELKAQISSLLFDKEQLQRRIEILSEKCTRLDDDKDVLCRVVIDLQIDNARLKDKLGKLGHPEKNNSRIYLILDNNNKTDVTDLVFFEDKK